MKRAQTTPRKRASRTDLSDELIRHVQREQDEILIGLVRVQSEALRSPYPPSTSRPLPARIRS